MGMAELKRVARKKDKAYAEYVEALIEHKGNGANACVASKRKRFERATIELHQATVGSMSK